MKGKKKDHTVADTHTPLRSPLGKENPPLSFWHRRVALFFFYTLHEPHENLFPAKGEKR